MFCSIAAWCILASFLHDVKDFCDDRHMSGSASQVGFIGLGNMGLAMAGNILKARGSAIVYDVSITVNTDASISIVDTQMQMMPARNIRAKTCLLHWHSSGRFDVLNFDDARPSSQPR